MERVKGILAVFTGAVSFGILSTFVKKAYEAGFTLAEVAGVQAGLGVLFLWTMSFISYKAFNKSFSKHPMRSAKWKIILSGVCTGSVSIFYYKCVELLPASLAIVMLMQYLWIGLLIERFVFGTRPHIKQVIGAILILGSTLLATGLIENDLSTINWKGVGYGLIAATAYALFLIVSGRIGNDYPPVLKSAYMLTGALVLIFITLTPTTLFSVEVFKDILPFGLLFSIFGTVLPPFLFAYGIPKAGIPLSNIISTAELPVAVAMSFYVLLEPVSTLQWTGVFIILLIIIWVNYPTKARR